MSDYREELNQFVLNQNINLSSKGHLAVMVQLTDAIRDMIFPIDPEKLKTPQGGQVKVLSGPNLKAILKRYGINKVLAAEGARTNRGSLAKMLTYVEFLNQLHSKEKQIDFEEIQRFWIEKVRDYFSSQPLILPMKQSLTVAARIAVLFDAVKKREKKQTGATLQGTVLQHLVGAKLRIIAGEAIELFGSNVSDNQQGRHGDFCVNKTVIHCTTAPSDALLDKCQANVEQGYFPIIVTLDAKVEATKQRAIDAGLGDQLEVWGLAQFISTNANEHGEFDADGKDESLRKIIGEYNQIISKFEADQSLKISTEG